MSKTVVDFEKKFIKGKCYSPYEIGSVHKLTSYFISEDDLFSIPENEITEKYTLTSEHIKKAKEYAEIASDDFHIAFKTIVLKTVIEIQD